MKLRNKKTGEVVDAYSIDTNGVEIIRVQYFTKNGKLDHFDFNTLEELNDCLEDYEPKEPLIKDEKIRKAVRAWAEATNTERIYLSVENEEGSTFCVYTFQSDCNFIQIATHDHDPIGGGRAYTIAELCGEEEE